MREPLADFEAVITERTRAILICNPSNPTGYVYRRDELEIDVWPLARRAGAVVSRRAAGTRPPSRGC